MRPFTSSPPDDNFPAARRPGPHYQGKLNIVPGWRNQLLALNTGLMPSRRLLLAVATRVTRAIP